MKEFRGLNGKIVYDTDRVTILRENKLDMKFHNSEKVELPVSSVKEIVLELGGLVNGYISILEEGDIKPKSIFEAIKDEKTIAFRMFKNIMAESFANDLRSII